MTRLNNRADNQLRPLEIIRGFTQNAPGSVLVSFGNTKVICTASIEDKVPPFLRDQKRGWLTAEYSMLPGATSPRSDREAARGKQNGRTTEIQRLIGRALRAVVDFKALGERTIYIDCDVIQADGGTRTASITGGMVALYDAVQVLMEKQKLNINPIKQFMAAISVGIVKGTPMLDLCYEEDSAADVDMNIIMTEKGQFVEIQGTAEEEPFSEDQYLAMIGLAKAGIADIIRYQKSTLGI